MDDLQKIKHLAGITQNSDCSLGANLTSNATQKAEYMKKHNIKPGTDEWFKLWFSRPHLTGENPMPKNN